MNYSITFQSGPYAGQTYELHKEVILIGRVSDTDIPIEDSSVSSRHAQLRLENGHWHFSDLNSTNGSTLNKISTSAATLSDGDIVGVGNVSFLFHSTASAPPPASGIAKESVKAPTPPPATSPESDFAAGADELALVEKMRSYTDRIRAEVGKVIIGQRDVLDQILMCILANGHALLIGLPGMAKTLTVKTIAQVLNLEFKRVQFTPDLMPGDIIGTDVLETNKATGEKEFRFIKGPIFCNLLLADEINRTPPKTQAALLEAMQEKMVTAGNTTYKLAQPFFVLATQNPVEQEGTYPLPEAQLDRFMFNIWVDYPLPEEEEAVLKATTAGVRAEPQPVLTCEELLQLQDVVRKVPVSDHVIKYVTHLVGSTRPGNPHAPQLTKNYISTGAGPRAGQCLILAAKATAILEGRIHVSCADIRRSAPPVLRHRLMTNFAADSEGLSPLDIVKKLLDLVPEPGAEAYPASSVKAAKPAK
jgi:MoxR-like ATPase